jgi:hypothetical protein
LFVRKYEYGPNQDTFLLGASLLTGMLCSRLVMSGREHNERERESIVDAPIAIP